MSGRPTLDQALDALQRLSPNSLCGGPYHCPWCDPSAEQAPGLFVNQNGTGPRYECKTGADGCAPATIERMVVAAIRSVPAPAAATTLDERARDVLTRCLNDSWDDASRGLKVARVIKRGRHVDIELDDGRVIEMGTASQMLNRRQFEAAILEQVEILIKPLEVGAHRSLVAGLVAIAERRDVVTAADETKDWIGEHLRRRGRGPAVDLNDPDDLRDVIVNGGGCPFRTTQGRVCVSLTELRTHVVRGMSGDRLTVPELSTRLSRLGFTKPSEGGQLSVRHNGKSVKARYWISRAGFEEQL
ncbi:MAG: hypothetical protein ACR2LK_13990 [Solirubrobacteraceae bacterium]